MEGDERIGVRRTDRPDVHRAAIGEDDVALPVRRSIQHARNLSSAPMPDARSFPIVYATDVDTTARFYELLGFERHFSLPGPDGTPGYVGLRRSEASELAVVSRTWPEEQYGVRVGDGVRFEVFVYVNDVDASVAGLRAAGHAVLRGPADMPWGERVGFVTDPDGNPVALAAPATTSG